ncbi:unnamed protein product [Meloidogyne enterolobii]|uniref:Uncharacterized protein n=1 Tax=Meloidogyne enterolobii TaxID=390850 RepID=A0ACB1AH47_MELEN
MKNERRTKVKCQKNLFIFFSPSVRHNFFILFFIYSFFSLLVSGGTEEKIFSFSLGQ